MTPAAPAVLLQHIRRLVGGPLADPSSDRELLRRFAAGHDEDAFAALVQRHGPMVWRVCRRALREHDAEDAFQAAFVVLARKAGSVRWHDSVAGWLHTIAARLALKVRSRAARCPAVGNPEPTGGDPLEEITGRELLAALDEEVAALPEKYRGPLLLCCLEGRTQEEAARQLGTSLSTVRRRLEHGRGLLHARLTRRGLSLSAALGLILLGRESASAVPMALALAAGRGVAGASLRALALADGLSKSASAMAFKVAIALALTLGIAAAGAVAVSRPPEGQPKGDEPAAAGPGKALTDELGDPLPPGALRRLGSIRLRHRGTVFSVAFSPDGKVLASAGWDKVIRLWDPATGQERGQVAGPERGVNAIAFSPDGKTLAGAGVDFVVYFWDARTGKEVRRLEGHRTELRALAFSPDGKLLATAGADSVRLWDAATGKALHKFDTKDGPHCVAFSPDGKAVAAGGAGAATVRVWEVEGGKQLPHLRGPTLPVRSLAFSPDGKALAVVGEDFVEVWDAGSGKRLQALAGKGETAYVVAFAPDGKLLATGGWEGTIRLWDWAAGKEARQMRAHPGAVHSLAFSPDGKALASGSSESAVHLWEVATGKPWSVTPGHQERVVSVACSADGRTVVTAAWDGTVRLWDAKTGKEVRRLEVPAGEPVPFPLDPRGLSQVALSPDGKLVVAVRGNEDVVLWAATNGKELHRFRGTCVAFSPDGKSLAVGGRGADGPTLNLGVIRLYDTATGKEVRDFHGHKTVLASVAFTPDGKRLVSRGTVLLGVSTGEPGESETNFVRAWDVATGKELPGFPDDRVTSVTVSPDGRMLASTTRFGKTITLWEMATRAQRAELTGHTEMVFAMAFAPDGRTLASGGMDGTVRLWDLPSGREIGRLEGHRGWVLALAFAPDGKTLVSGSLDTTALVWDVSAVLKKRPAPAELTPKQLDARWESMAGGARPAYEAMAALVASPKQSVPLLSERLKPATPADPQRVTRLLADLDAESFEVREKAAAELEKIGELAEPALRRALKAEPSAETRRRLESLLEKLNAETLGAAQLQGIRAVEALEQMGTAEARQLLEALAKGAPEARLTQEAKAALGRLEKR